MKKFLGFCLVGLWSCAAFAAGAPLVLDWGTLDTSAAAQQKATLAIRTVGRATAVQQLNARGAAPWLVQFDDVVQDGWRAALEAAGAKIKGYMPENGFLVEASPKQIAAISALDHVAYVGEFLPEYKRAAKVRAKLARVKAAQEADAPSAYRVVLLSGDDLETVGQKIEALTGAAPAAAAGELIQTDLTAAQVEEIAGWGEVQWIEAYSRPRLWNDVAVRTNMMNVSNVWTTLGLTGAGQIIAVADTGLDTGSLANLHPDFTNRVTGFGWSNGSYSASYSWADFDAHGSHVCGSVLGSGLMSTGRYKGVAYEANLIMQGTQEDLSGIPTALSTLFRQAFTNGARIHSDSWGYDDHGYYNSDSLAVDQYVWSNKTFLICIAAGNSGTDSNTMDGVIDPMSVASPATAKNCLTVGAAENYRTSGGYSSYTWGTAWPDDYGTAPVSSDYLSRPASNNVQGLAAFSSRGPCNDGRIKPDIVAPGTDIISTRSRRGTSTGWGTVTGTTNYLYEGGTSMATPLTAGAAGLTRQWVTTTGGITNPSAALLKALMLNGARNMVPGQYGTGTKQEITARPDNAQGFGHVDLYNTLQPATNQFLDLYDTNSLATGQTNSFTYVVTSATTNKFILTLAYADYWGTAGSGKQLVNDLDLTVVKPGGTTNYANGRTSKDATNNVELIEFAADEAGTYTVRVSARTVPSGSPQPYALVVRGPAADETPTAPVFGANPGPVGTTTGVAVAFTVSTSAGYPTPVLALQSTTASTGYSFTAASGQLNYTPPVADVGTKTFTFTATNASGAATQTVSVVVSEAPPAAPASIWASATNTTGFTAAWSSVSGATGYRLDVGTNATFSAGGGAGGPATNCYHNGTLGEGTGGTWTETGLTQGSGYLVMLTGDELITPAMDFTASSAETLTFNARTYGGAVSNNNTVTVSISTDNGGNWSVLGTRTPLNTTLTAMSPFDLSGYDGSQVLVKLETLGSTTTVGAGIDEVLVTNMASSSVAAYVPGYSNLTVAGTSQGVTGLTSGATYYFRARAVNGGGTSPNSPTASVTTVASAVAPTFGANPGPAATTSGVAVAFVVSATGTPTPTLALQSTTASSGYVFTPATGQLDYTPPQADGGATQTFTFTASNSAGVATQTVSVAVTAGTAPAFTGGAGPYSTTTGVQVAFTVSASGTPTPTLALQSTTASTNYSFVPATGAFAYTPPEADVGTRTFTFTAANVAGTVTQVTSVVVSAAPAPPAAPAAIWASATNSGGFTAAWSSVSNATGYRLDVGTNATFSAGGGAGVQSVLASNAASSPSALTNDWSGYALGGTTYIIMTNSAAVITSAAFSTAGYTNLTVDFRARTYGGTTKSNVTVSISGDDGANWTVIGVTCPPNGSTFAAVPTLTDTAHLGGAQTRIRWQSLDAGSGIGVGVSNLVVLGWSGGAGAPAYVPGYSNLTVAGTSQSVTGLAENATYYFRARAVNAVGASPDSATANVTTTSNAPAGTPPVMNAVTSSAALTGRNVERTVTATPTDGDPILSYACTTAVDTNTWDLDAGTGDFLFVPTAAQIGANVFSFTATDKDGASAPTAMTVTVSAASAPTMNAIPAQIANVGATFDYTVSASEPDGDAVTFACTSTVDGATWDADTNGYFLFLPTAAQLGTNVFSFTATDRDGTSAPAQLSVKVYSAVATNEFTQWVEDEQENPADTNYYADADADGDGQTTYEEYLADTDPAASNSVLRMEGLTAELDRFSFPASPARFYQLEYCTDITNQAGTLVVSNLGWGVPGMVITNVAPNSWFGTIRVLLDAP